MRVLVCVLGLAQEVVADVHRVLGVLAVLRVADVTIRVAMDVLVRAQVHVVEDAEVHVQQVVVAHVNRARVHVTVVAAITVLDAQMGVHKRVQDVLDATVLAVVDVKVRPMCRADRVILALDVVAVRAVADALDVEGVQEDVLENVKDVQVAMDVQAVLLATDVIVHAIQHVKDALVLVLVHALGVADVQAATVLVVDVVEDVVATVHLPV